MALLVALLIVLTSFVSGASVAKATEVNGIQSSSIHLEKMDANEAAIYMWSAVRANATWRVPNGTGRAGDTFMLTLPKELIGSEGSFDLKGKEGDSLAYGTCQVTKSEVVCTLNENVENKNDVGGSLWVKTQVGALTEADKLTFGLRNGVTVDVPLPDGQSGIGYKPYVPTEIDKSGWFPGADQKIQWRIVVPGSKVSDRSSMTITDNFAMAGVDLTVAADSPSVFWVPSTPKCWNEISSADCYNALTTSSTPSSEVTVDNDGDTVKVVIDNKGQNFEADRIYIVDLLVDSDSKIFAGSRYTNQATVDNEVRSATAVKETSGGGTGSGDTVGHIGVKKVVTGGDVASDTVYPVAWSYDYNGTTHQGELSVKGDGTLETLSNIPNGTVVTLTENVPSVTGVDFGDPAFSGDGVTDGVPNATSAQVAVEGLKTREVTLTNQVNPVNPKLASVQVTPRRLRPWGRRATGARRGGRADRRDHLHRTGDHHVREPGDDQGQGHPGRWQTDRRPEPPAGLGIERGWLLHLHHHHHAAGVPEDCRPRDPGGEPGDLPRRLDHAQPADRHRRGRHRRDRLQRARHHRERR